MSRGEIIKRAQMFSLTIWGVVLLRVWQIRFFTDLNLFRLAFQLTRGRLLELHCQCTSIVSRSFLLHLCVSHFSRMICPLNISAREPETELACMAVFAGYLRESERFIFKLFCFSPESVSPAPRGDRLVRQASWDAAGKRACAGPQTGDAKKEQSAAGRSPVPNSMRFVFETAVSGNQ